MNMIHINMRVIIKFVTSFTEPSATKKNRGSPNNNGYYVPEGNERPVHIGNKPLLFSSGFLIPLPQ